ncbi:MULTISPECIES: mechanosensitive ion channel family protein [unclassified Sinorhizobium]|uniref:mechanosensitive ion channel family protein n=1 Tax=unclassified Sinorhizobium TaxID=2613772 RepID=UPI00352476EA
MEQQATDLILATRTALNQASALAVQYSFSILGAIILLLLGWILASFLSRWAYEAAARIRGIDETLARFFANVLHYAMLTIVIVTVLGQFGVQTASIIAALGAAGLAIGLALQGTLQNIAAGIMLLILRPFRVGEFIDTGSVSGTVKEIGLFATELRTADGVYRLAPNSTLWNTPITNFSREATRKNDLAIRISYDDDIDLALKTLSELAEADNRVLKDPATETFVDSLGESYIVIMLRYWTTTADWWNTSRDMIKGAKQAFDKKGISIPYPQVTYTAANPSGDGPPLASGDHSARPKDSSNGNKDEETEKTGTAPRRSRLS